ncbi:type II toxin-antitoxin system VapB family antitoxin [Microlunatus elymi]|uniref:Type II toxin-antitoxin system VapB family antitoxin n=1 Tax=Microlunatus elymi TaxID=2596828 RepID=A0A516Q3M8_9ACTN|nr:type II toxin-antitoxin system VapB family antitoxin [Microlunatus elymi]QDP98034.1 type II toxin-antitoxin system VapB family antitoxin [Microlunatus elymi]
MRTNIEIDDRLMAAAQAAAGTSTKKETVERGLELLVRLGAQSDIRELRGKLVWTGDLDQMRTDVAS